MGPHSVRPQNLGALLHLARAVGRSTTLDEIFDAALDGVRGALGIDRASILLFDADGVIRFKAWRGLSSEYRTAVEGHSPWTPGQAAPPPLVVPDVTSEASLAGLLPVLAAERIAALAFVPLLSGGRVIGKFMLYAEQAREFAEADIDIATLIGHHVGFAVERTRNAVQALADHRRLLFALDAAQMGTWEWELATNTVRWSDNLERIHGLPPGTFTGEFASYEREIHPDDRPRVLASLQRALEEDTPHDVEYRIVAPDGTVRWVLGKGRLERDRDGRPSVMSGVCMDIGSRKRAELETEAAFREQEAIRGRLTELATGSNELLTSLSADSVNTQVLALARRVLAADAYAVWRRDGVDWHVAASRGLSAEFTARRIIQQVGVKFENLVVAPDVASAALLDVRRGDYEREGIRSLVSVPLLVRGQSAGAIVFYYRLPHRPGEVELQVASALGHLAAAAVSNAELYEEQQALRAEAELAARWSAFLAEASAMLSTLDYERNLRKVAELAVPVLADWCAVDLLDSDGAVRRLAVAHTDPAKVEFATELLRRYPPRLDDERGLGRVIRTGTAELYAQIDGELLEGAAVDAEQLRLLQELHLESVMIVPLGIGGRTIGALTFVSSTPGRHYGAHDIEVATELARRAAYAIENARLYREAQEANRLKDEFLATLSHELRTPLNVMLGRAQVLAQSPANAEAVRSGVDAILRNGDMLAHLIEDLLDVSRITLGQLKMDPAPLRLLDVVEAALQSVQPAAAAKGVALVVVREDAVPPLVGDATRLQQVIWNLLSNAVKFTPAGGRVTVAVGADATGATLAVTDTGRGIDTAFLPHVFDMFRQAEPATQRTHGGLGLGLAIVRRIVELHGGTVAAASAGPGHGATFRVHLPVATPPTPAAAALNAGTGAGLSSPAGA